MCGRAIQGGGVCVGGGGLHSRGCWHYGSAVAAAASTALADLAVVAPGEDETSLIHVLVALRAEGAVFRFPWE